MSAASKRARNMSAAEKYFVNDSRQPQRVQVSVIVKYPRSRQTSTHDPVVRKFSHQDFEATHDPLVRNFSHHDFEEDHNALPVVRNFSHQDFEEDYDALLKFLRESLPAQNWSRLAYEVFDKNNKHIEQKVIMDYRSMEYEFIEDLQNMLYEMVGDGISTNTWKFTLYSKP
jgi:hypothetical protein